MLKTISCHQCDGTGLLHFDSVPKIKCYDCDGTGREALVEKNGHIFAPSCQCATCINCLRPECWAAKVCPGKADIR